MSVEADESDVVVRRDDDAGRYEIAVEGRVLGYADFHVRDGVMVLPHTVTDPASRGQGLAGQLVKVILDEAREDGVKVSPQCWYVAQYIDNHPEYADLVA